jgi:alpha-tubulin suppressor-like RCC1 family protein
VATIVLLALVAAGWAVSGLGPILVPPAAHAADALTAAAFASPPVAVGGYHTCVLPGDGTVLCWGDDTSGQLGDGRITDPSAPGGDVVAIYTVLGGPTAREGECSEYLDGAVLVCSSDSPLRGVTAIAAGFAHTCALLADTTVRCWGANAAVDGGPFSPSSSGGQLGDGTTTPNAFPVTVIAGPGQPNPLYGVTAITAASDYTCALMSDSTARCWGNAMQATGTAPVPIMADASHPLAGITALAAGDTATCALLTGGGVDCWGSNIEGLLGDGGVENASSVPVQVLGAGSPSVPMSGVSGLVMGHDIPVGENGVPAGHACVLDSSVVPGGVHCWGVSDSGQLGRSSAGSWLVTSAGGSPLGDVIALAAGTTFSCALRADGSVDCWGGGYGTTSSDGLGSAAPVPVLSGGVVAIAAGGSFCAVLATGGLSCLGFYGGDGMVPVPGITIAAPAAPAPTPSTPTPSTPTPSAPSPSPSAVGQAGDLDHLVGDWSVTYGAPVTVSVTFAAGTYTVTTTMPTAIASTSCSVPAGTVMETFTGSGGNYAGQQVLFGPTCQVAQVVPLTGSRDSAGAITVLYNGTPGRHVLVPAAAATGPSLFRNSIPTPAEINLDLATVVLPTVVAGVGIIVLVPFPGALFNSTLRTNYAELLRRGRRARRRMRNAALRPWFALAARLSIASGPQPIALGEEAPILSSPPAAEQRHDFWWTWPGVGVFVLLTALLSSFLDPAFWFDAASAPTFIGMLVGLVLILAAFDLPSFLYYRRSNIRFWPRALPGTFVVALACVAISRLTDFHPGYLYGLVITTAVAATLGDKVEGKLLATGVVVTLAVAIGAWLALGVVAPVARASSDPLLIGVQTVLSMLVSDGVQVTAFGLLPLSFLAGEGVRKWNRWVHAGLWLFGLAAFGVVILNPQNGYLSDTTRTPLATIVALFAIFSIGSIWFWRYFRDWHRRMAKLAPPALEEAS